MEMPKQDSPNLPLSGGLVALAITVVLYLTVESPFRGARPQNPRFGTDTTLSAEDVQARLWEDPFAAVERHRDKERDGEDPSSSDGNASNGDHSIDGLVKEFRDEFQCGTHEPCVVVMPVMVFGGPYAEEQEARIRTRHAVLSALGLLGYQSKDEDHIGYVSPQPCDANEPICLPKHIPYEWFISTDSEDSAGSKPAVLLLWLDDNHFHQKPWQKLACLVDQFKKVLEEDSPSENIQFVIQGPAGSTVLRAMAKEAQKRNEIKNKHLLKGVEIYSPKATVAGSYLPDLQSAFDNLREDDEPGSYLPGLQPALDKLLKIDNEQGGFYRTIGTDTQLAEALIDEINRRIPPYARQGYCPPHITLISEWDTFYGRTFPTAFADSLERAYPLCFRDEINDRLARVTYLRGIDGQGPESSIEREDQAGNAKDSARPDKSNIEHPAGPSQFDYLRRLAKRLEHKTERIAAIGVVGSDVYDKLLVLQALRDRFPGAIFFTTDLDAIFTHPEERDWTRNLIVASHFGLELREKWQEGVAPFRGSYQTAHFFTTKLALGRILVLKNRDHEITQMQEDIDELLGKPRIFEIGRSGAFNLSVNGERSAISSNPSNGSQYPTIHPERTDVTVSGFKDLFVTFGRLWPWFGMGLAFLLVFLLLYRGISSRSPTDYLLDTGFLLLAVLSAAALYLVILAQGEEGEPFAWFEGISIWPTEYLRLFAAVLALYLLVWAWRDLNENISILDQAYFEPRPYLSHLQGGTVQTSGQTLYITDEGPLQQWQSYRNSRISVLASLLHCIGNGRISKPSLQHRTIRQFLRECDSSLRSLFRCLLTLLQWIFWSHPSYRYRPLSSGGNDDIEEQRLVRLWINYHEQNRFWRRFLRVFLITLLFRYFAMETFTSFESGFPPARGDLSFEAHSFIIKYIAAPLLTFLIFWVLDATMRSVWLIKELCKGDTRWPAATREHFAKQLNVDREHLNPWLDIQFVTEHTAVINRLVYFPVMVIIVMLLSRALYFDEWHIPLPLIIVLGLLFAYLIYSAIILRSAAEHTRTAASDRLHEDIIKAAGGRQEEDQRRVEQLRLLLEEVHDIREGAFLPLPQQPWLRAVLLLLGGGGGLAYLQYFIWSQ